MTVLFKEKWDAWIFHSFWINILFLIWIRFYLFTLERFSFKILIFVWFVWNSVISSSIEISEIIFQDSLLNIDFLTRHKNIWFLLCHKIWMINNEEMKTNIKIKFWNLISIFFFLSHPRQSSSDGIWHPSVLTLKKNCCGGFSGFD